jgi:hypothetical protein
LMHFYQISYTELRLIKKLLNFIDKYMIIGTFNEETIHE